MPIFKVNHITVLLVLCLAIFLVPGVIFAENKDTELLEPFAGNYIHYGDVNGDGAVNVNDAALLLHHIVGLIDIEDDFGHGALQRAKVSGGGGDVDPGDAILILGKISGLIDRWPVDAYLSALAVSTGSLHPAFHPGVTEYEVAVNQDATSIAVTANLSGTGASMTVNGTAQGSGIPRTITLQPAGQTTTITIVVTAADKVNTNTYTITVKRMAANQAVHSAGGVPFYMRQAPAATFPIGVDNNNSTTVADSFWIAETPVTYELWDRVRTWAVLYNGYTFMYPGAEGGRPPGIASGTPPSESKREPVTMVSVRDAMVWCNALTSYYNEVHGTNLSVVYMNPAPLSPARPLRHATTALEDIVVREDADGFRLPTVDEWELAARYQGGDYSHGAIQFPPGSGQFWTPGSYASGATNNTSVPAATGAAAWYWANSNVDGTGRKTQPVGQKPAAGNLLGLYDMSGNVYEWCFTTDKYLALRGGSFASVSSSLQVGDRSMVFETNELIDYFANFVYFDIGFRFAANDLPANHDATLGSLAINPGVLDPAFSAETTGYTAAVAHNVNRIHVTAVPSDASALMTIDGKEMGGGEPVEISLKPAGQATEIVIAVLAKNGLHAKTYTVTVNRAPSPDQDANLSALSVSTGSLHPAFHPGVTEYEVAVNQDVSSIAVTANLSGTGASMTVNGTAQGSGIPRTITLQPAGQTTTITIVVTAADKAITKTYTIAVKRMAANQDVHSAGGVPFYMRQAPAATFPIGVDNNNSTTVADSFWIAETPVTYELWDRVRTWALLYNGYTFMYPGAEGGRPPGIASGTPPSESKREPVTMVSVRDAMVWCNALTSYYNEVHGTNLSVVYTNPAPLNPVRPLRHATTALEDIVVREDADGFRLPTADEWELAARYQGGDYSHGAIQFPLGSGQFWTPGSYASGATNNISVPAATGAAAWYSANSNVDGTGLKTQPVGQKPAAGNLLGLYDMSGNVYEWCYSGAAGTRTLGFRGGSFNTSSSGVQIGLRNYVTDDPATVHTWADWVSTEVGFRFARAH